MTDGTIDARPPVPLLVVDPSFGLDKDRDKEKDKGRRGSRKGLVDKVDIGESWGEWRAKGRKKSSEDPPAVALARDGSNSSSPALLCAVLTEC